MSHIKQGDRKINYPISFLETWGEPRHKAVSKIGVCVYGSNQGCWRRKTCVSSIKVSRESNWRREILLSVTVRLNYVGVLLHFRNHRTHVLVLYRAGLCQASSFCPKVKQWGKSVFLSGSIHTNSGKTLINIISAPNIFLFLQLWQHGHLELYCCLSSVS